MTIQEALDQLRTVVPAKERTVCITVEVMDYDHYDLDDPKRRSVQFRVWDGRDGFYAHNLEAAVQKCLLANGPKSGLLGDAEPLASEAESLALTSSVVG